jgi:hypothetical protein
MIKNVTISEIHSTGTGCGKLPNLRYLRHFTPTAASWLNLAKSFFAGKIYLDTNLVSFHSGINTFTGRGRCKES